ncbi:MAG: DUF2339 domain-containing protein [Pseudomonadota bacterium]
MSFLLTVIFGAALIYLWRKSDALEVQLQRLDETVDALHFHLSSNAVSTPTPAPIDAPDPAPASPPPPPKPSAPEEEPAEVEEEIPPTPSVIPATRVEEPEPTLSEPLEQELIEDSCEAAIDFEEPEPPRFAFDFEDFFGRLLPIWAGGIALAVAGFFLVRYSIEQGWLGPQVRVALGFLFGGTLLGAAELAYRNEYRIADPRVRQALAGAGLATLYASFYFAGSQYGLIASAIAFLGLAGVTGAAILLSFRFGLPSAILGLVGGFAAPMLVSTENPNLALLALYLSLVTGGLTYAGNRQGRSWLALAALAGGIGWGALMLFSGVTGYTDVLAFGGYMVVLGAILPAFTKVGEQDDLTSSRALRFGAAALAAIQMGVMVAQSGFSLLAWGLYTLLAAALAFFAWSEPRLREASAFAAALGLVMLGFWFKAPLQDFALVGAALLAVFCGVPLANIWRRAHRDLDAYQLSGFALGMIVLAIAHLVWSISDFALAGICLVIAGLPALASWRLWPDSDRPVTSSALVALVSAAIGTIVAGLIVAPAWAVPLVFSTVALGVIALGWNRGERGLTTLAWGLSLISGFSLIVGPEIEAEFGLLGGIEGDVDVIHAVVRWTAAALPFIALAFKKVSSEESNCAQVVASLLVYGIAAQILPATLLAWTAAGLAILAGLVAFNSWGTRLTLGLVTVGWSLQPLAIWTIGAMAAASGAEPMLIADHISLNDIALRMLPVLAICMSWLLRPNDAIRNNFPAMAAPAGLLAAITAHMGFKHIFAIETAQQFVTLGLAERTLWQGLLFAAGMLVAKLAADKVWSKPASIALFGIAFAHFALFTLLWHNPFWDEQAVGGLPIANLLLPAYSIAIGAAIMLKRLPSSQDNVPGWVFDTILMGLISLLALSELRHLFAGSFLTSSDVGTTEDLLRSVIGIALAVGFLCWGARTKSRSWRLGSLVLMLAAVIKVFVFDASALDGLLRVTSFIALGLSLIGIGWFYTRQLASLRKIG